MTENNILQHIRLATAPLGARLFRNNCGQYRNDRGDIVRYGVSNPGGSDLIGFTPVTIAGQTYAIFTAVEVKSPRGRLSHDQRNFLQAINRAGGLAFVARSADDAVETILKFMGGCHAEDGIQEITGIWRDKF